MPPVRRAPPTENPPQGSFRRRALLSRPEAEFHQRLLAAVGDDHHVFIKLNLNDILACTHPGDRWRIAQKHVDFVVVDPDSLDVVVAVELDDPSHEDPVNALHDQAKDHFLGEAAIPVARVWLDDARAWSAGELRERLLSVPPARVPYPGRKGWPPWVARLGLGAAGLVALWLAWRLWTG